MRKRTRKVPRPINRKRHGDSRTAEHVTLTRASYDLASLFRGLYHRLARQLGVDPSYVSRVARRERRSKVIEHALRRELSKIVRNIRKRGGRDAQAAVRKKGPKKGDKK